VRAEKNVTLERIANETGFSVDYLRQVESGQAIPPVGAILQIARALEIDSASLLKEPGSRREKRITSHTKRTENYAYKTLTPGTENKHLKAFKVVIDAQQEHKGVGYQHEGEEFDYVLTGKVQVTVGRHVNTLSAGDSLHFNSGIPHTLRSISDERAELIVVIYTP
jgi:quercetin dioxygenase-like cupin family protein